MKYVHGYSRREALRLSDQASTLAGLLHPRYYVSRPGQGCSKPDVVTGCQTCILTMHSPGGPRGLHGYIPGVPLRQPVPGWMDSAGLTTRFVRADLFFPPFRGGNVLTTSSSALFLEHLKGPCPALSLPSGIVFVPGGYYHGDRRGITGHVIFTREPRMPNMPGSASWDTQAGIGGNSPGRTGNYIPCWWPQGSRDVHVSPRMVLFRPFPPLPSRKDLSGKRSSPMVGRDTGEGDP